MVVLSLFSLLPFGDLNAQYQGKAVAEVDVWYDSNDDTG